MVFQKARVPNELETSRPSKKVWVNKKDLPDIENIFEKHQALINFQFVV